MGKWRARGAFAVGWGVAVVWPSSDLESFDMTTYCKNLRMCRPSLLPDDSKTKIIKQELF